MRNLLTIVGNLLTIVGSVLWILLNSIFWAVLSGAIVGLASGCIVAVVTLLFGGDAAFVGQTVAIGAGLIWAIGTFMVSLARVFHRYQELYRAERVRALEESDQ